MLNKEKNRKDELLAKYRQFSYLTPEENKELTELIEKDETIDKNIKFLLLFGLAAMLGYILGRKSKKD